MKSTIQKQMRTTLMMLSLISIYGLNTLTAQTTDSWKDNYEMMVIANDGKDTTYFEKSVDMEEDKGWNFLGLRKMWVKQSTLNRLAKMNREGELPKGVITYISSNRRGIECGLEVVKPVSEVLVDILDKQGTVVKVLHDGQLMKGWSNFKWKRPLNKRNKFILRFTVDGQSMTQNIIL